MKFERKSGILLHPTSLPSRFGIGDLGSSAYEFIDFLIMSGQRLWQTLPLGPTGYGESPYQLFSAFAGNHFIVSPEKLQDDGLLDEKDMNQVPSFDEDNVDFSSATEFKMELLKKAYENFKKINDKVLNRKYENFCRDNSNWLANYSLFMALKQHFKGVMWSEWDKHIANREEKALEKYKKLLRDEIEFHKFLQYEFFKQWIELKDYANRNGIELVGDIPIFVAYDSADAWSNREIFQLDAKGYPIAVAGVPPDFFSETGQLWGNPLYNWEILKESGYSWWIERFKSMLKICDIIRIDHFRGFAAYWSIPYGEKTAVNGKWVKGPGADIFYAVEKALGKLPIIAEDLGVITPDVTALREEFEFPGMKILHFGIDGMNAQYLPHGIIGENFVVYTGTHDNDTTYGFFKTLSKEAQETAKKYMNSEADDSSIVWDFIRTAFCTTAALAITPMQDILELGTEARMNMPGIAAGNWRWRYKDGMLNDEIAEKLSELTKLYGR